MTLSRSRFLSKLLEAVVDTYPVIPEALRFYRENVDLETAVGLAVDEQIAVLLSALASRSPILRRLLCPRLDTLYARLVFNTALKGLTESPARRLLASLRPCLLPRVEREALRGDADIVAERLSSTPYGALEARRAVDAAAELEALIARRARSMAVQGAATNPLTIRYAIAAHEHILLDVRDLSLLANASRHGLPRGYVRGRLSYSL